MFASAKRSRYVMVSSDSETSDNENQQAARQGNIRLRNNSNLESNLNSTVVSNIMNEINDLIQQDTQNEQTSSASNASLNVANTLSTSTIQTSIEQYLTTTNNSFEEINSLNENTSQFRIRCKVIHISPIRHFGTNNKVFDAIICDMHGETKVVGFNGEIDRLYNTMNLNQKIIIENGQIKKADERYRPCNSVYEIRLGPNSHIRSYDSNDFNPQVKIVKTTIITINQLLHGAYVDIEGQVVMDKGIFTTTSENNGAIIRRRVLKIQDETGSINITVWNKKIDESPELAIDINIRIRKGRINHFNDYVSINVSEGSIIQIY